MLPRINIARTEHADYMLFSTGDAISAIICRDGDWDVVTKQIALIFCADIPAPLIVDVGANLGAFSVPIAKAIAPAGGKVYAYEPQRIVFYQLCGNAFLNRLDNLHVFNNAVGDGEGWIDIPELDYQATANVGGFTLDGTLRGRDSLVRYLDSSHKVRLERLDAVDFPKPPTLLKIDVEGLELDVLRGARRCIEDGHPPILLEAWTLEAFAARREELIAYLRQIGYGLFLINDEIIAQHPDHPRQFEISLADNSVLQVRRLR